jgi:hypothetical protein
LLNLLRLRGYNTSIAVSKPSAAIFLRMILLCMLRTIYKTIHPVAIAATASISIVVNIFFRFIPFIYTKIVPVKFAAISFYAG